MPPARPIAVRSGFSLLEMTVVVGLSGFLMLLVSGAWLDFGNSLADTVARAEIHGEASMAFEALRRDFGGHLPGDTSGELTEGILLRHLSVGGVRLMLCYDGAPANGVADWAPPDTVITYRQLRDQLVRVDRRTGATVVVAAHVRDFRVSDLPDGVRLQLTLSHRGLTRAYTLVTRDT